MSKLQGLNKLAHSLVDIGASLKASVGKEAKTAGSQARQAARQYLNTAPTQAGTRGQPLANNLRITASQLKSKMAPRQAVPDELSMQVLEYSLKRASEKLVDHSSAQGAKMQDLATSLNSSSGIRAQFKTELRKRIAVKTQQFADPAATKLAQGAAYVRAELQASDAKHLAVQTATVSSNEDLVSFKASLLKLPANLRSRPMFSLALNSWSYAPALRTQAYQVFHELRSEVPDDGGHRLSAIAGHLKPMHADDDRIGGEAWLLASPDERRMLVNAFQQHSNVERGEIEALVVRSCVADDRIAALAVNEMLALARELGFETKSGCKALDIRRSELKIN
jgi:hypothetical protein